MKKNVLKKLLILAAVTTIGIGGLTACASGDTKTDNTEKQQEATADGTLSSEALKKVIIAGAGIDAEGNVSLGGNAEIAKEQGFIEEELNKVGYTAEYVGFQNAGVGANEALAAKEADIAIYGDFPAITYIATGNDARIFAGDSTRNQLGIFAREGIDDVKDLKGKKICTMLGTTAYLYLVNQLQEAGLSIDDVEVVNSAADAASLFLSGEVDAIANGPQLFWSIQLQGGKGKQIAVNGNSEELSSYNVVIGRSEFLDENSEVEQAIVNALERAHQWANENEQGVYDSLAKASGYFTAEQFKEYYSFEDNFDDMAPEITDAYTTHLQKVADFLYESKAVQNQISVADYLEKISIQ